MKSILFSNAKKLVTLLVWTVFFLPMSFAAYLTNVPQTLVQPNGDTLHCFATGDEYYHRLHDANGYTIVLNPANGYYVYADKVNGEIVPTRYVAGRVNPAEVGLTPNISISAAQWRERRQQWEDPNPPRTHTRSGDRNHGHINNLVVFIRFADDDPFENDFNEVGNMFNDSTPGHSSMYNYFKAASYNQLAITASFYPAPSGSTILSYQDIYNRGYYQPYSSENTEGYSDNERTSREFLLLKRAVENIADMVPDDLNIDYDNDGLVDNIVFVVRGNVGEWNDLLWPHQWSIYNQYVYINGKRVYKFNFQLADAISYFNTSVLCHEMNHSLGAPDLYHYSDDFRGLVSVYTWDLMHQNTNPPQHMGAWMKYRYGNWIESIPQITECGTYSLHSLGSSATNNCYFIASPNDNEFFVLEYRNKSDLFEGTLPGSGLLVYRINTNFSGNADYDGENYFDEVYIYRPFGTPTENGNITQAAFSENTGRTEMNENTSTYPFLTDGTVVPIGNFALRNISEAGGDSITFTFCASESAFSKPTVTLDDISNVGTTTATCSGTVTADGGAEVTARGFCWSSTDSYPTVSGSHSTEGSGTGSFTGNITGLAPNTSYAVRAYATNSEGTSYSDTWSITTYCNPVSVSINGTSAVCAGEYATLTASGTHSYEWNTGDTTASIITDPTLLAYDKNYILQENFDNGVLPTGWSTEDGDGDGYNWYVGSIYSYPAHSGTSSLISASYISGVGALSPDNWLYTPAITIPADVDHPTLSWWARGTYSPYEKEHYAVSISTDSQNWLTAYEGESTDAYVQHTVDLSDYAGRTIYVAFQHYAVTDMYYLFIDDIEVYHLTPTNTVTYTVIGSDEYGCTATASHTVTIRETPDVTISGDSILCEVSSTTLTASGAESYLWSTDEETASISVTPTSTTTYTVIGTSQDGCTDTASITVTISSSTPLVTTGNVSDITTTSATCGGEVVCSGAGDVTARGVCWSTSPNPTVADSLTIDGTGTGIFTSSLTGLSQNTTYYVRAYATNSEGTGYGDEMTFTTDIPTLLTEPTSIDFGTIMIGQQEIRTTEVIGSFLDDNITATVTGGPFTISTDNSIFETSVQMPSNGGTLYIKYTPTAVETNTGVITLTCGDSVATVSLIGDGYGCVTVTEFPYETNFTDDDKNDCWTIEDANEDNTTFAFSNANAYAYYSYNSNNAADDWLISPVFSLTGNEYATFDYEVKSSYFTEKFEVAIIQGNARTIIVPEIAATNPTYQSINPIDLRSYIGDYQIGIHCTSDADKYILYFTNFKVEAGTPTLTVSEETIDFGTVPVNGSGDSRVVVSTISISEVVELSTEAPFAVSLDGITFATTATIPADANLYNETTVYVRFTPAEAQNYSGTVELTAGTLTKTISVTGNGLDCGVISEFPYETNFTNEEMNYCWTIEDANNDDKTFYFNTTSSRACYTYNSASAADDWLISPVFLLTGNEYATFDYAAANVRYPEKFEVALIQNDTRTIIVPEMTVTSATFQSINPIDLSSFIGDYQIGIHCTSDADMATFYITNFKIDASVPSLTVSEEIIDFRPVMVNENADDSVVVSTFNVNEAVEVSVEAPFAVSLDGITFATTATIPAAMSLLNETTVYVRFTPTVVQDYYGTIVFTAGTLADTVYVTGNGFDCGVISEFPYETNFTNEEMNYCWTIEDANNDDHTFDFDINSGYAYYIFNGSSAADDWLTSPVFMLTGNEYATFDYAAKSLTYPERFEVYVINGGEATMVAGPVAVTDTNYTTQIVDLNSYTGETQVAIHCTSDADMWRFMINHFEVVTGTPPTQSLIVDYALLGFYDGTTTIDEELLLDMDDDLNLYVIIQNNGPDVPASTDTVFFDLELDGYPIGSAHALGNILSTYTEGQTFNLGLAPFFTASDMDAGGLVGTFEICWTVRIEGDAIDPVASNNTACVIINRVAPTQLPSVITNSVTDITTTSATCGGEVTDDGGATVTARGVCWSTTPNPTVADSLTIDGTGTGTFTSSLTNLTPNTTYYVRAYATNSEGTAYGEEMTFTTPCDIVNLTLSGNDTLCAGESTTLTAAGAETYLWSTAATIASITVTPAATTTYTVTGTNLYGCSATDSITVTVHTLPVVSISGDTAVCAGESTTLTAAGAESYLWSTADTIASITVTPAATTTYTVTGTNQYGCSATDSITVTVHVLPVVTLSGDTALCAGESATLTAAGAESYLWSTADTIASITVTPAATTTYTVTGTTLYGCSATDSITVTVHELPVITISGDTTITEGSSTTLSVTDDPQWDYQWSTGDATASITVSPAETTSYSVTVTDGPCVSEASITVTVVTGVNEWNTENLHIYPNPTTGIVNVEMGMADGWKNGEIQVFDVYGRKLSVVETMCTSSLQIDLSRYPTGVYMLKVVKDGKVTAIGKVVKE